MIPLTLRDVAVIVGGTVHDATGEERVIGPAFVDSRHSVSDGLFVAVAGEHVDGHDYAAAAVAAGASAALAERPVGVPAVVVEDSVQALGRLSRHVVDALPSLHVIAITGSQGKTSTKDMLAQVLEAAGDTVAPAESFNNEIGVPLTALAATDATRFLVVEMGARGHGHIRYLTSVSPPQAAIVLNVGMAHVGEFGSRDDIAVAKAELVEALPPGGVAVLNADDRRVSAMAGRTRAAVVTFGESAHADVRIGDVRADDAGRVGFDVTVGDDGGRVRLSHFGRHQACNAAAVIALATSIGVPFGSVVRALEAATSRSRWRMEVATTDAGVTVINDAYNANPDSTRAALETLAELGHRHGPSSRTFAVLGEMRELGEVSSAEHEEIGRLAVRLGVSSIVTVGDGARPVQAGAAEESRGAAELVPVTDAQSAIDFLRGALQAGDVVLVKASRAVGLEQVALALTNGPAIETSTKADA